MTKQIKLLMTGIGVAAFTVMMCSCGKKDNEQMIGKAEDDIKLSAREVGFSAEGGESSVSTEGTVWWFTSFLNSETYAGIEQMRGAKAGVDEKTYACEWVSVSKSGLDKIVVHTEPNSTGADRSITVEVTSGDYADHITINQTN
ncbi:MAG: hypothetical protein LBU98_03625 [Alistipes sp.]|jgi:hypothetical protein|nr:hypothetical protein [Alistipes sp.]